MRILLIIGMFLVTSLTAMAAEKKTEVFTLDHQMSSMCEKRIKDNLRFEKGIEKIDVSLKSNTITITYNPSKTDTAAIIEGFKKIGFTAFVVNPECSEATAVPACCNETPQPACCNETPQPACCGACGD